MKTTSANRSNPRTKHIKKRVNRKTRRILTRAAANSNFITNHIVNNNSNSPKSHTQNTESTTSLSPLHFSPSYSSVYFPEWKIPLLPLNRHFLQAHSPHYQQLFSVIHPLLFLSFPNQMISRRLFNIL